MNLRIFTFSVAIFIPACFGNANGPEGSLPAEPFDMEELRTTWRNLANEQVMFPLDMKDMPAKIGKERQLFLDNYLIAEAQKGGSIKVALLSQDSQPMEQYSLKEAVPIETGGLTVPVKWKRASQFELPNGEHVRIQFQLANAKLYSFWIE
jgi:hypothetical protein